jgi:hypothetical protein
MAMDPGLWELYESGSPDDEVSVILRLAQGAEPPPRRHHHHATESGRHQPQSRRHRHAPDADLPGRGGE